VSLRQSLNRLQGTANHILGVRNSLRASGTQTWNAKKQAEADLFAFNNGLTPQQRLFGLGVLRDNLDGTGATIWMGRGGRVK